MISITFLALSLGLVACDNGNDEGSEAADDTTGDGDGDSGDGDGEAGDGDGESGCFDAPPECLRFVDCIGALVPDQLQTVTDQYGADGSCWCGTEEEAVACYETCIQQLDTAIENNPTESACHESKCSLEELDPEQPYGPVVNGACPDWNGAPQQPFMNPLGLAGSYCAPECSGIAMSCHEHTQTSADGTCLLIANNKNYCVSYCWVDPTVIGGTQCQCGATCQPYGGPDGEGNLRGICTFE